MRQNREVWSSLSEAEKKERAGELRRLREKQREVPSKQFRDCLLYTSYIGKSNIGKSNIGKSYAGKTYVGKSNAIK